VAGNLNLKQYFSSLWIRRRCWISESFFFLYSLIKVYQIFICGRRDVDNLWNLICRGGGDMPYWVLSWVILRFQILTAIWIFKKLGFTTKTIDILFLRGQSHHSGRHELSLDKNVT
jgi:hypothetical protein